MRAARFKVPGRRGLGRGIARPQTGGRAYYWQVTITPPRESTGHTTVMVYFSGARLSQLPALHDLLRNLIVMDPRPPDSGALLCFS